MGSNEPVCVSDSSFRPLTRIYLLVTSMQEDVPKEEEKKFQTVDTDFSPGDYSSSMCFEPARIWFQTVDTDFSPGDECCTNEHTNGNRQFQTVDTDFSPGDKEVF